MVTVAILSADADAVAVDDTDGNAGNGVQSALTFTAQNWSAAQAGDGARRAGHRSLRTRAWR